jgi:hypothetical protein
VKVTANHHAIAQRFSFSDNFYADSETSADGHRWLTGTPPDVREELSLMASGTSGLGSSAVESGDLWRHLERHGVSFRIFSDAGGTTIPDQVRVSDFIRQVDQDYGAAGKELPRMIYLHLPNDRMARPRPEDGYPFGASFVADNDLALGRVVEYLSHSRWWPKMAIFVSEASANGADHIDSHRTLLLAASPYAKTNHVSRVNTSFPGLRKTILRLLRAPPMTLYDAAAADLADCFTVEVNLAPTTALPVPKELFDPETLRGSKHNQQ